MRMRSPSSTQGQENAWSQETLQAWLLPRVTQTAGHSYGSGVRVTVCTMWTRPCALRWTCALRRCHWSTAAPTFCCGGVAWTEPCTLFTRWPWLSPTTKCLPNVTPLTPGCVEDLTITSAISHTVVSVVFLWSNLWGKILTYCKSECSRKLWAIHYTALRTDKCLGIKRQEMKIMPLNSVGVWL